MLFLSILVLKLLVILVLEIFFFLALFIYILFIFCLILKRFVLLLNFFLLLIEFVLVLFHLNLISQIGFIVFFSKLIHFLLGFIIFRVWLKAFTFFYSAVYVLLFLLFSVLGKGDKAVLFLVLYIGELFVKSFIFLFFLYFSLGVILDLF